MGAPRKMSVGRVKMIATKLGGQDANSFMEHEAVKGRAFEPFVMQSKHCSYIQRLCVHVADA